MTIPGLSSSLAQSSLIISPASTWDTLREKCASLVHTADFWQSATADKPLSMAEVRLLRQWAERTPTATRKIAFLQAGDTFRGEVANALLKLLEEPPSYLCIVVVAETNHLLPTLLSRLLQLHFQQESAIIKGSSQAAHGWQKVLGQIDAKDRQERERLRELLYLQPLVHTGINEEAVLNAFK